MTQQELQDRMALKDLVDRYATESDKNNQDYYREIFTPDIKLKVYFGKNLGMDINNVEDMIAQYKAFGAAKASFHQNGLHRRNTRHRHLLRHRYPRHRRRRQGQTDPARRALL